MQYQTQSETRDVSEEIRSALSSVRNEFNRLSEQSGNFVSFEEEAGFVYQNILSTMNYQQGAMAYTPVQTILSSFLCIARTGLSSDPKKQLCHLKSVYDNASNQFITEFDFNYRGYLQLIARSKVIKVITADVIYQNDTFEFNGTRELVTHKVKALSPSARGDFAGGYCTSELINDAIVTTVMSPEEINQIEHNAKMYEGSAWNSVFIDELRRKTLIRRHWKTLSTLVDSLKENTILSTVNEVHQNNDILTNNGNMCESSDSLDIQHRY
ncbi:recombinase RecT [Thalassotalea piscium]|uniref:Recombinational DNA repair protein RecT n=1 Tax=Thalassotalea piscium TaxID=1230533 RepID=A0A7X0NGW5_9GAMM|nr:recombinase RecT [Thalassotalea piscium]MBB6543125.1 recombinational DNA repair protein RecT [Thalassotalea piscium]